MATILKKSVLKADKNLANQCWIDFQKLNEKEDWKKNGVEFRKKELTEDKDGTKVKKGSFEIRYTRMVDGVRKGRAVFRYVKTDIGSYVEWDEKFVTI